MESECFAVCLDPCFVCLWCSVRAVEWVVSRCSLLRGGVDCRILHDRSKVVFHLLPIWPREMPERVGGGLDEEHIDKPPKASQQLHQHDYSDNLHSHHSRCKCLTPCNLHHTISSAVALGKIWRKLGDGAGKGRGGGRRERGERRGKAVFG